MSKSKLLAWSLALPMLVSPVASIAAPQPSATAHASRWPAAHSPAAITDAATEKMIDALIAKMTVEQKVGQLVQADISTIAPEDLKTYPLGSILAGGNSGPYNNERASADDWHKLVESYRAVSLQPGANGVAVPILFGVDAVHGHSNLPNATIFPHNIGLGATHDPNLIRRIGEATASEVSASGIEWTFAPTLAVPQDLRWGRSYEGYSSDPKLVAAYARAMVEGLQGPLVAGKPVDGQHVAATAKHFLADGGTHNGKDQGDAQIDEAALITRHAQGYPAAIDAGSLTVMASFSSWNGVKNHGNRSLLTDVLKGRMGFKGLVVGDWNGHGQVAGCTVTDCPQAVEAGLDLFMAPDSWKGLYESLVRRAKDGSLSMARVDDAVRRILRVKAKLGLMGADPVQRYDPSRIGTDEHRTLAREAVAKSLVLLKNEGSVLPIKPGAKVLVAGAGADNIATQAGGWTISWQGSDVTAADFAKNGRTIYHAIDDAVRAAGGSTEFSEKGDVADTPDVAIVVFGEKPYAEFLGDVPTLDYQPMEATDLALLKALKAKGIPVVSVFLSGRPMFTNPEINVSDAFVAAWLPGTQGDGVADVLVARADGKTLADFRGRLPFAWPGDARSPVTAPLFKVGYGLSYAKPGTVGILSEDPKMDVSAALNVENFFVGGRAPAPWAMTLVDAGGSRALGPGETTSATANLTARPVDLKAQEDGRLLVWTGPATAAIEGPSADLSRQLNNAFALRMDVRVDSAIQGPVKLTFADKSFDIGPMLKALPAGQLHTLKIPLRCFADAGANVTAVTSPLRLDSAVPLTLALGHAGVEAVGENLTCPAPIAP